jgi:hypothetical protein
MKIAELLIFNLTYTLHLYTVKYKIYGQWKNTSKLLRKEVQARANRQDKEIISIQIAKEKVKLSLLAGSTILYRDKPKDYTKNC